MTNLQITNSLGCIQRGYQWQLPRNYFGFPLPDDISKNLSKAAVTTVVGKSAHDQPCSALIAAFALVLATAVHHAYVIRYSYRQDPIPNADKMWALAQIHFVSVTVVFIFTWIAFIAQAAIIGNSVGGDTSQGDAVAVFWGQSPWLVLAAAIIHIGWGYEAVRWRAALLK